MYTLHTSMPVNIAAIHCKMLIANPCNVGGLKGSGLTTLSHTLIGQMCTWNLQRVVMMVLLSVIYVI